MREDPSEISGFSALLVRPTTKFHVERDKFRDKVEFSHGLLDFCDNILADNDDVLKAQIEATSAAIEVLVLCLERNGLLKPGQYLNALRDHMELNVEMMSPMTLTLLANIRENLLH